MDSIATLNSTTHDLLMSFRSLDIPSLQQLALLVGVFFYLIFSLFVSLVLTSTSNLSSPVVASFLAHSGPTMKIFDKLSGQMRMLLDWTGLSSGCIEALVCGAGKTMESDFPKISGHLKSTIDTVYKFNMDRYTRLLVDAMIGQGECQEMKTFDCPVITSAPNPPNRGTEVMEVFAQTIYLKTISRIILIALTLFAFIFITFIVGFLIIILKRKPRVPKYPPYSHLHHSPTFSLSSPSPTVRKRRKTPNDNPKCVHCPLSDENQNNKLCKVYTD